MQPTMQDFDLLDKTEIAALTEEQITHYCRVAAMEAGVVMTDDNEGFLAENKPEVQETEGWVVTSPDKYGSRSTMVAFADEESARAFVKLNVLFVDHRYLGSGYKESMPVFRPATALSVERKSDFVSEEEFTRNQVVLDEYGNAVAHNEKLRERRDKAAKDYRRASECIWETVKEAREEMAKRDEVRACWEQYGELARDEQARITCMKKAYPGGEQLLRDVLGKGWDAVCEAVEHVPAEGDQ